MSSQIARFAGAVALVAAAMFALALAGFGAALDGYSHAQHPPALLGAQGMASATMFNVAAFVLPGVLAALVMIGLRARLDGTSWLARIGSHLWLLSAVAFALQGFLPLDPRDLDAPASQLHASAWTAWWLAFVTGAVLLAVGLPRAARWTSLRMIAAVCTVLLPLFALASPMDLPVGASQRVALALWFGCFVVAGLAAQRHVQP